MPFLHTRPLHPHPSVGVVVPVRVGQLFPQAFLTAVILICHHEAQGHVMFHLVCCSQIPHKFVRPAGHLHAHAWWFPVMVSVLISDASKSSQQEMTSRWKSQPACHKSGKTGPSSQNS